MDIFAVQLKRITCVPIRQKRVKINAPNKGSASKALTDDIDHNENHEQYFELPNHNTKEEVSLGVHLEENNSPDDLAVSVEPVDIEVSRDLPEDEYIDREVIPEFIAYAKKPRIPREELKQLEAAKKSLKHLDLFI